MDIGWPQIIYLALSFLAVGIALAKHGERREPWNVLHSILGSALALALLWWGGFFH